LFNKVRNLENIFIGGQAIAFGINSHILSSLIRIRVFTAVGASINPERSVGAKAILGADGVHGQWFLLSIRHLYHFKAEIGPILVGVPFVGLKSFGFIGIEALLVNFARNVETSELNFH
jgi:hypothetical protein